MMTADQNQIDRDFGAGQNGLSTVTIGTRELRNWLDQLLKAGQRPSLFFVQLEQLDLINDSYGRQSGDLIIVRTARRLAALSRKHELSDCRILRTSGDQFCLGIAGALPAERLAFIANEVGTEVQRPHNVGDGTIHVQTRIGAVQAHNGEDGASMLSRANDALTQAAKAQMAVKIAEPDLAPGISHNARQMEKDLHHAIARGEIDVCFQPQFEVATGRIVGAEALARWNHDQLGPLGAGVLFSVATRSQYLLPLSHYIQERALNAAAEWTGALSHLRLSLNITPQDLAAPGFLQSFLAKLDASGLAPARVTIEITESGLMHDVAANAAVLDQLRARDMRVAVDDFGTGYSSLAWLKSLPLDYLKLDQGLTADIMSDDRGRIIVQAIIAMGQALRLKIVAEGVETEAQLALLAAEGCDYFQGFLRAPALDAAAFKVFAQDALAAPSV
jgi:diguanylate cyclase (GGDEF)-like protein